MNSITTYDHHLPKTEEVNRILNKVHSTCIFGSTNKFNANKLDKNNLSEIASEFFEKNDSTNPFFEKISKIDKEKCLVYYHYSGCKLEPVGLQNRKNYLTGLINIAKVSAFSFAFGNCEPMTDIAFIEAANANLSCGIHYVLFTNKNNPLTEELNTLVLGDWPLPGCLIVSPWQSEFGISYTWQGDCAKTSAIKELNLNHARSIFSIHRKDKNQEKEFIKNLCVKLNYKEWLKDGYLISNIENIKSAFFKIIHQASYFEKWKYLNFQDLIMYGSTSKNNYNELEKIRAHLMKEVAEKLKSK